MGTYYKHRKTESIKVPYSFRCEQCMKESGPLTATISGMEATINSNFKNLDEKREQKLGKMAHENLVSAVKEAHQNATGKNIYVKAFKDECPHCHKPQSWAVSGLNVIKVSSKKKQTSTATQKNTPVIEWSAVQNILNE